MRLTFTHLKISAEHISKRFGQEWILRDFSYTFQSPESYALLGKNGSGKSTLLQMLSGFLTPTGKGKIHFFDQDEAIEEHQRFTKVSIAAPYLELIEELTLQEFMDFHFRFKQPLIPVSDMLHHIGLNKSTHKFIRQFSSGMKQRVKLAQCIFSNTPIVLLDEPCTNLDQDGVTLYNELIATYGSNRLLIVASNDPQEYSFCKNLIHISDYAREAGLSLPTV